jgi:hypothetical protein
LWFVQQLLVFSAQYNISVSNPFISSMQYPFLTYTCNSTCGFDSYFTCRVVDTFQVFSTCKCLGHKFEACRSNEIVLAVLSSALQVVFPVLFTRTRIYNNNLRTVLGARMRRAARAGHVRYTEVYGHSRRRTLDAQISDFWFGRLISDFWLWFLLISRNSIRDFCPCRTPRLTVHAVASTSIVSKARARAKARASVRPGNNGRYIHVHALQSPAPANTNQSLA